MSDKNEGAVLDTRLFGSRLTRYLDERGMSDAELARKTNSTPTNVWKWKTGESVISVPKLILLTRALKVSADELLKPPERGETDEASLTDHQRQLLRDHLPEGDWTPEQRAVAVEMVKRLSASIEAQSGAVVPPDPAEPTAPAPRTSRPPPRTRKHRRGAKRKRIA